VIIFSGDAYIDHPSFAMALLGRLLESQGYRVGLICQPDWRDGKSVSILGRPRLFCGIGSGALDSMLCHYTAFRKIRHQDAYTPGGEAGKRPNRAVIVYSNLVRSAFPGLPVVIGGIEASLRRLVHYDFWSDSLRRSLLLDSKADLLVYGMGERAMSEIARRLAAGESSLTGIRGTCHAGAVPESARRLPSMEEIKAQPKLLIDATRSAELAVQEGEYPLVQDQGGRDVVIEPPAIHLTTEELDGIYELPFTRRQHPSYKEPIPALATIQWSICAMRGCAGGCSFCSLALHQSRHLVSRSAASILREAKMLSSLPGWKGHISDVGGPTANLWGSSCRTGGKNCRRHSCLEPDRCPNLVTAQMKYLDLLRKVKALPGVRHVDIASGIRHDVALLEPEFIDGIVAEFVGGHLKLAPEHRVPRVLELMRKSRFELFEKFCRIFSDACRKYGKEQYIVPYVMSAFPGCTHQDMRELTKWFSNRGWTLEQSQCFIPTPGTMATAMYYAMCAPDGTQIHVARSDRERLEQHGIMFPKKSGREDFRPDSAPHRSVGRQQHSPGSGTPRKSPAQPSASAKSRSYGSYQGGKGGHRRPPGR
ncbi:MAG: YgiQ family radical SAM protein, partial [Victivallales bacterium]|nr:YgiQ family radical SAM protein [Victivallales bacterium]